MHQHQHNMHGQDEEERNQKREQGGGCDLNLENMNWEIREDDDHRQLWFGRENNEEHLLDVGDDAFISYDDFPPLPDFPCMSSSSSSSCSSAPFVPEPLKCPASSSSTTTSSSTSSSSSSAASWAVVRQNIGQAGEENTNLRRYNQYQEEDPQQEEQQALLSSASTGFPPPVDRMDSDCMQVMEELGDMDLFDADDIWDPSSLFPYEDDKTIDQTLEQDQGDAQMMMMQQQEGIQQHHQEEGNTPSEDLAMVFFEWLKTNKESISAEDLRSIKLKRSTIECAARRLGGGKEGMKQLLKLILEWVQNHQLQKKKRINMGLLGEVPPPPYTNYTTSVPPPTTPHNPPPNPNPNPDMTNFTNNTSYMIPSMPQWSPSPTMFPPNVSVLGGYVGDQQTMFNNGGGGVGAPFNTSGGYHPDYQTWPPPPPSASHYALPPTTHHPYNAYQDQHFSPASQPTTPFSPLPNQYPCQMFQGHTTDRLIRLGSSATKEARKKRMARQKRFFSHPRTSHHNQQQHQNASSEQQSRIANDTNCTTTHANPPNWVFWCSTPGVAASPMFMSNEASPQTAPPPPPPPPRPPTPPPPERPSVQPQHHQRPSILDKRQGGKTGPEKNLKFLLQKVLKQSDVGNLGRIVLPKKEAETYLPHLEARDGISIDMEDIGTSRVWNMRYRYWPNNKSRMYLLENTGDFVRSNGLQEGDFIVIYSDIKCGKYLIRGVKVRQQGSKSDTRKHGKTQRYLKANSSSGIGSSSSTKEAIT